jgi:hypothetical protein
LRRDCPQKRASSRKGGTGVREGVDVFEKALMRQYGNRLPKELEAKLAQIVKMAASRPE